MNVELEHLGVPNPSATPRSVRHVTRRLYLEILPHQTSIPSPTCLPLFTVPHNDYFQFPIHQLINHKVQPISPPVFVSEVRFSLRRPCAQVPLSKLHKVRQRSYLSYCILSSISCSVNHVRHHMFWSTKPKSLTCICPGQVQAASAAQYLRHLVCRWTSLLIRLIILILMSSTTTRRKRLRRRDSSDVGGVDDPTSSPTQSRATSPDTSAALLSKREKFEKRFKVDTRTDAQVLCKSLIFVMSKY